MESEPGLGVRVAGARGRRRFRLGGCPIPAVSRIFLPLPSSGPRLSMPSACSPGAIEIRGLAKDDQEGELQHRVLASVDLEIPAGSFVVLIGPSGSGKSTLLNLLGGIDLPSAGHGGIGCPPSPDQEIPAALLIANASVPTCLASKNVPWAPAISRIRSLSPRFSCSVRSSQEPEWCSR